MITFTRLDVLKKTFPNYGPFYSHSWIYAGLTAYYSQLDKFDQLEFVEEIMDIKIKDFNHPADTDLTLPYYGNVFEGHPESWFPIDRAQNITLISGFEHLEKHPNNVTSLGFDYWDVFMFRQLTETVLFNELNRSSVADAIYDVVIPVGNITRPHRITFLKTLNEDRKDLTVVTDDNQNIVPTNLRFDALGLEVYFNKVGASKFICYQNLYHSFYDTNQNRSLDQLPHKKMHAVARVNMALETTCMETNSPYLTEKTYKILAQARPFIIFGDTLLLKKLKSQGLKTFEDFCDESYDLESDVKKKSVLAINALHQLVDACKKYPEDIDRICKYNQDRFFDRQRAVVNMARFGKLCLEELFKEKVC